LLCGALNAQWTIHERNSRSYVEHLAVLRFRSDKIAKALGLSFRTVTVRKGIWDSLGMTRPTIRLANEYSRKVRGLIAENSLWNVEASTRYIAPDNLHAILADICGKRVEWDSKIEAPHLAELLERGPVVSTLPLPRLLDILPSVNSGLSNVGFTMRHAPISVSRYTVRDCDVFQTVYFPDPHLSVYRATLTGELLTVESTCDPAGDDGSEVYHAFGLRPGDLSPLEQNHVQQYGKIAPVPDMPRKALLHQLTARANVYSLGRFATWRNILLDDVFDDIFQIRKMLTLGVYDATLQHAARD
jgi:hypothetical protein